MLGSNSVTAIAIPLASRLYAGMMSLKEGVPAWAVVPKLRKAKMAMMMVFE
jgi:hypothetical protein